MRLLSLFASNSSRWAGSIVLLASTIALASPAQAEGSRDLANVTGNRPFLEYRVGTDRSIGIPRRTIIKVFANAGETLNLASSAVGLGNGAIIYRAPGSTTNTTCPTTVGLIPDRAAEFSGSYTPCTINVMTTGVWEVEFVSPDDRATANNPLGNPAVTLNSANWTQSNASSWVAAWDVTVRDSSGNAKPGRAFADYLSLNMGANGAFLHSKVYIQTKDGYGYTVDMNGIDPFGFIFFANNKGFYNTTTNNPIYRSLQLLAANGNPSPNGIPEGYDIQRPSAPDASGNTTHKIFFSPTGPDSLLPPVANTPSGSTWLLNPPASPPAPSNLTFEGVEGTSGRAGTSPLGGNFKFTAPSTGAFTITLDLNRDGIYGNNIDRTLIGTAVVGANTIKWDGLDGNGAAVPASTTGYNARVEMYAGEVHFPFIDPENNPQGMIIRRVRDPGTSTANPNLAYFDDRNNSKTPFDYSLCASGETGGGPLGCYGTAPTVRSALNGLDSSGGTHRWSGDFGDRRGMDTWAFYPSGVLNTPAVVVVQEADLAITKTDNRTNIPAGSATTYTIVVTNNGPSDVTTAPVKDTMSSQLSNVTWTCTASTGSSCADASGTGNIDTAVNLLNGGTATYTVQAVVNPTAAGTLSNTATVLRPSDVNDPTDPTRIGAGNNTATDATVITPLVSIPNLRLVKRITALNNTPYTETIDDPTDTNDDSSLNWTANYLIGRTGKGITAADTVPVKPNDTLEYTIYFLSDGAAAAQSVTVCDLIPPNTTFVLDSFNSSSPKDDLSSTGDFGMRLTIDTSTVYLSNNDDAPDRGRYVAPSISAPCGTNGTLIPAPNGAVTIELNNVPNATAKGTPNSFGFIRFRAKVN